MRCLLFAYAVLFSVFGSAGLAQTDRFTSDVRSVFQAMVLYCIQVMESAPLADGLVQLGFSKALGGHNKSARLKVKGSFVKVLVLATAKHNSTECTVNISEVGKSEHRAIFDVFGALFSKKGYQLTKAALHGGRQQDAYSKGSALIRLRYRQGPSKIGFQMNR